jgi:hypothetical protein
VPADPAGLRDDMTTRTQPTPVGNFSLIDVAELQVGYILKLVEAVRSGACDELAAEVQSLLAEVPDLHWQALLRHDRHDRRAFAEKRKPVFRGE